MASNKVLISQAVAIALALNIEAVTEGLNNADLSALVKDLKAKATEAGVTIPAGPADDKKAEDKEKSKAKQKAKATKVEKKPPFYVMKGKAITSKRGILADGDEIKAGDLAGGQEALDDFVETGHIGKA